jgi:hypothetical protein
MTETKPETLAANLRSVPTGSLEIGNVVRSHGMRVRIDAIRAYDSESSSRDSEPIVWACLGTVLNLAEVLAAHIVPRSWLFDTERENRGPGHGREDVWIIQGNNLATWTVEG